MSGINIGSEIAFARSQLKHIISDAGRLEPWVRERLAEIETHLKECSKEYHNHRWRFR